MKILSKSYLIPCILVIGAYSAGHWRATQVMNNETLIFTQKEKASLTNSRYENLQRALAEAQDKINFLEQKATKFSMQTAQFEDDANFDSTFTERSEVQEADDFPEMENNNSVLPNDDEMEVVLADFETKFWQDEEDFKMTEETEGVIQDAFNEQNVPDTSFDAVQCHTSLCLAEFVHQDEKGHDILLQRLNGIKPFSGGYLVKSEQTDGQLRTLVYFPQAGESLSKYINLNPGE